MTKRSTRFDIVLLDSSYFKKSSGAKDKGYVTKLESPEQCVTSHGKSNGQVIIILWSETFQGVHEIEKSHTFAK